MAAPPRVTRPVVCLVLVVGVVFAHPALARQPAPLCAVAAEADYGRMAEKAVPTGGGAMYGASRQRRYLDGLRGPKAEVLRYTREGAMLLADGDTLVDRYTVTYDGLATPVTLYLDAYHFAEPKAPQGFICTRPLSSGLPEPDLIRGSMELDALAAEVAAAPGFRAGPVDLGGEPAIGLLFDAFRIRSRRIRPDVSPGRTPPGAAALDSRTIVVAWPQTCDGRVVSASGVALVAADGAALPAATLETTAAAVRARAPGQTVPSGSIAALFPADALLLGMQVRVTFDDPACAATRERQTELDYRPAELLPGPMPARPAGDTSGTTSVAVQAIVDHQGALQRVKVLGGPPELMRAAEAAVRTWKARPARVSGAPIAVPVIFEVTFAASGAP